MMNIHNNFSSKVNTGLLSTKDITPVFLIISVILFAQYEIFFGADFFVHQDQHFMSSFTFGNSIGNGWRPEKGFGISFFYGDSSSHAWSIFSFWEKILHSQKFAHVSSVVFLELLAGIALYFFLKLVVPMWGRYVWLLCPLVVLTAYQAGTHYMRYNAVIVGVPLLLIVLYKYYSQPRLQHFFYFALIFWFVFAFGSICFITTLLSLGFFFSAMYYFYFKVPLKRMVVRFSLLFSLGVLMAVLLSFWMFYSNLVEIVSVGYMREKVTTFPREFNLVPDVKGLIDYFLSLILFEWRDWHVLHAAGLPLFSRTYSVVAIFPLLFLFFLFRRANSFWEFSMKGLIMVFLIQNALLNIPIYRELQSFFYAVSMTLLHVYGHKVVFIAQIALIAIFISEIGEKDLQIHYFWGRFLQKGIACLLFIFYGGLALFCLFALFIPDVLPNLLKFIIETFGPDMIGSRPNDLLAFIALYVLHSVQDSFHWYSFIFFSLSTIFMLLFLRSKWLCTIVKRPKLFAGLLLICAVTMSWTVSPLNTKDLGWEGVASSLPVFKPTDRFYFTRGDIGPSADIASYKQKREVVEEGSSKHIIHRYGYEESPGLKLHGHKSFTQKDVAAFVYHAFNEENSSELTHLRHVTEGPLISSELLDMGAVSYYYSRTALKDVPKYLSLCFKSQWLYIYKNLNAWPYFFLAEQLGIKKDGEHLKNIKCGTAYLAKENFFPLHENAGNSSIELKEFSYGKMVFDFSGNNEEFLVVADAWHPHWKAYAGDKYLPIVKANEIFKGVKLPKGEYTLTMEFDTSPYLPGVYISITFWILFLSAWIWVYFRGRHDQPGECQYSLEGIK